MISELNLKGAVCFSTWRARLPSRVIRLFTGEKFTHTFLISDQVDKRHYILEADHREVRFNLLEKYKTPKVEYEIWVPKASAEDIEKAIRHTTRVFLKQKYSFLRLASLGVCIMARKYLGWALASPIRIGTICSEVMWYYSAQLFPDLFEHLNRYDVKPADLRNIIISSGRFELVEHQYL